MNRPTQLDNLIEENHLQESKIVSLLRYKSKLQRIQEKITHLKKVEYTLGETLGFIKKLLYVFIFISLFTILIIYFKQDFIILYDYLKLTTLATNNVTIEIFYPKLKLILDYF